MFSMCLVMKCWSNLSSAADIDVWYLLTKVTSSHCCLSTGTNYAYDWHLKTHPKDYSGVMEERHSRTLKLSKVAIRVVICWKWTAGALFQRALAALPGTLKTGLSFSAPSFSSCQLTVGLYEFEVTVEGEGAHGKGYVNVTVKPGECKEKGHL